METLKGQDPVGDEADAVPMRERIKGLATELLVRHGYRGVSFGDLAEALGTTRANIHYHFGNKVALVDAVIEDYVAAASRRFARTWIDPDTSFVAKIEETVASNYQLYLKYNASDEGGLPWSLIARMRQDSEVIGERSRAVLKKFGADLHGYVVTAVETAIRRGELVASAPVEDIAIQIVAIMDSAGHISQNAGSFARLEQLYYAFGRVVMHAYGRR